jgi:hypothetical protein
MKFEQLKARLFGERTIKCPLSLEMFVRVYLPVIMVVIPLLMLFAFVYSFGVNVPHWDEWANVDFYRHYIHGDVNWWAIFQSHNGEHHEFFKVLFEVLIERLTYMNMKAVMYCGIALQAGAFFLLVSSAIKDMPKGYYSFWILVPLSCFMFSFSQHRDALWGLGIAWYMITFCLFLALKLLSFATESSLLPEAAFGFAAVVAFIASFCSADGLLVWPAGCIYLWFRNEECFATPWKDMKFFLWTFLFVATTILYVETLGVHHIGEGSGLTPGNLFHLLINRPLYSIEFYAAMLGAIFINQTSKRVVGIGLVLLLTIGFFLVRIARTPKRRIYAFPVALMAFGLLHAGFLLIGRLHSGIDEAISSSYAYYTTFIIPLIVGIYLVSIHNIFFASVSKRISVLWMISWVVFSVALVTNNTYWGIVNGRKTRMQRWLSVSVLLDYTHQPAIRIERMLTDDKNMPKFFEQASFLERNHLSVFHLGQGRLPVDVQKRIFPPISYLSIMNENPTYKGALRRLWEVYFISPDLKEAYDPASPTFVPDLINWARGDAISKGYYLHPYLDQYATEYISLAAEIVRNPSRPLAYLEFEKNTPQFRLALEQLWRVYLMAPDLQKSFPVSSPTFTRDLIRWTAGEAKTRGYYLHSYLDKYGEQYGLAANMMEKSQ